VIAVDTSDLRLELAKSLGAVVTINAKVEDALARVKDMVGEGHYGWGAQSAGHWSRGARADVVIEAAGSPSTLPMALEMVRHGGTVVQIALFEEPVALDPTIITQKNIRLQGCAGSLGYLRTIDLVQNGQVKIAPMITHRFPLEDIVEAFETQMRPDVSGKVVIIPGMN
jgi:threonine dehydrogenase-like Zn-dependent dehydrogenase